VGAAPETQSLQQAELTEEQAREKERQWFLDAETGEIKPDEHAGDDPRTRPRSVRAARWTFD
jgi:hypothetical protein